MQTKRNTAAAAKCRKDSGQRAQVKVLQSTIRRSLWKQKIKGFTRIYKPLGSNLYRKVRLDFAEKYRDNSQKFWDKVF